MAKWEIVGGPTEEPLAPGGYDGVEWTWEIERGSQRRKVTIAMAGTLRASTDKQGDVEVARQTKGRNYVEAVLDREEPPRRREADSDHTLADNLRDRPD